MKSMLSHLIMIAGLLVLLGWAPAARANNLSGTVISSLDDLGPAWQTTNRGVFHGSILMRTSTGTYAYVQFLRRRTTAINQAASDHLAPVGDIRHAGLSRATWPGKTVYLRNLARDELDLPGIHLYYFHGRSGVMTYGD